MPSRQRSRGVADQVEAAEDLAEERAGEQPAAVGLRGEDVEDGRRGDRAERQEPAHPDHQHQTAAYRSANIPSL